MSAATVVIGLGNVVMSDDGLGVHAVQRLRERPDLPSDVELIEGGTAGLLLLPHLADAERAILIDAIDTGAAPGTLVRMAAEQWIGSLEARMTPHDIGVADLLGAARFSGGWPEQLVLHGIQPATTGLGTALSAPVEAALSPLLRAIAAELRSWETLCA